MTHKNGYYLFISDGVKTGVGECSYIEGLSADDLVSYEQKLKELCNCVESNGEVTEIDFSKHPSVLFGYETAMADYENGGLKILYESDFTEGKAGIPINGLIWMGTKEFMLQQMQQKLDDGFICIKVKVGAIDFEEELRMLAYLREQFPPQIVELRLDANGAFSKENVFDKLRRLAEFGIHSIEQPVKPGQYDLMKELCAASIIPVVLDEELIPGSVSNKLEAIHKINPQFIILKPSLLGGFSVCNELLLEAETLNIGWWVTSALESNIGLNAIAQWTAILDNPVHQGLGTGGLYQNNVESPLFITEGMLAFDPSKVWGAL